MKKKRAEPIDWIAIRAAWEAEDRSISDIAKQYAISPATLYRKRKLWLDEKNGPARSEGADAQSQLDMDHVQMVRRLYRATDQQISHLEAKLESGDAAFDEKEARMLGTIARTLDKILELTQAEQTGASKGKGNEASKGKATKLRDSDHDDANIPTNPDALRQELAQRLEKLQQGTASGLSGDPK